MVGYRFFFVGSSGHVTGRIENDCAHDSAALEHAETLATNSAVEVWEAARFIARVKPANKTAENSDRTSQ
jgi:hypothetical protein